MGQRLQHVPWMWRIALGGASAMLAWEVQLPTRPTQAATASSCEKTVVSQTLSLQKTLLKARAKCRADVLNGKLPPTTDCRTYDPKGKLAAAAARLEEKVQSSCDDALLAMLEYPAACGAAAGAVFTAADVANCIVNAQDAAANMIVEAAAPAATPLAKDYATCEKAILDAAVADALDRAKALTNCARKGGKSCEKPLDKLATKREQRLTKINKKCAAMDEEEDVRQVLGYVDACSGEGGTAGATACLVNYTGCVSETLLPLALPEVRGRLDAAGRINQFQCTGVSAGVDTLPVTAHIHLEIGSCSETVTLAGDTVVKRQSQVGDSIKTEIVEMQLGGNSGCLGGPIILTQSPTSPSTGRIDNVQGGNGGFKQGDAFFDLFFEIDTPSPSLGKILNVDPFRVTGPLTTLPPQGPDYVSGLDFPVTLAPQASPSSAIGQARDLVIQINSGNVCCDLESFVASGDSYDDSGGTSHKRIKFTFKVKAGEDPKECVLVNYVQGSAKNGDGTYRTVTQYGMSGRDNNFPTKTVDSVDTDPAYWSTAGSRWNYREEPNAGRTYSASDDPGPAQSSQKGSVRAQKFTMCIYCITDVPANAPETGTGIGTAKQCINWEYSVVVDNDGKFSHPALR
jgi:hypothetical protein